MWPFRPKKTTFMPTLLAKKSARKVDKIATGFVLGGIITSLYGFNKISKAPKEEIHDEDGKASLKKIIKWLVFGTKDKTKK